MSFDPSWSSEELAKHLCDYLVAKGQLKEKPAFIRSDRQAKIAEIFTGVGLDGPKMDSFNNPGPLEMLVRKGTQGEAWVEQVVAGRVEQVVAGLVAMLPQDAAAAEKKMDMDEETKEALAQAKEKSARMREIRSDGKGGKGGRDRDEEFASFGGGGPATEAAVIEAEETTRSALTAAASATSPVSVTSREKARAREGTAMTPTGTSAVGTGEEAEDAEMTRNATIAAHLGTSREIAQSHARVKAARAAVEGDRSATIAAASGTSPGSVPSRGKVRAAAAATTRIEYGGRSGAHRLL
eukprot:CAMPEP_0180683372 /NCGR_PEP_ID=MMETSP1037_2-20121125/71095_1 /TAXON_ID=632150 /ORGANISM="Azadinium spinosum, Strain 3D9" /LENGTH=295 /DNA_ID=CAMNT_0022713507 /DNA_START=68 /DNA_END=956 /DNA_ORIENTATION=+